jgi:hypothetical protein
MGVNIQRGARLGVPKQICHRADIHILCDQQAGVGVPQTVDGQLIRQVILFQDLCELIGIAAGHNRISRPAEEHIIIVSQWPFKYLPDNFFILTEKTLK